MDKKAVTRAVKGGHIDQDVVIRMWDGHAAEAGNLWWETAQVVPRNTEVSPDAGGLGKEEKQPDIIVNNS